VSIRNLSPRFRQARPVRGRAFNGNRRRSWTVIQPLTMEPATERIGWDSEIPTSGATRRAPRRIGKRRIIRRPLGYSGCFHCADVRYARFIVRFVSAPHFEHT
jgi:hypothetical protein